MMLTASKLYTRPYLPYVQRTRGLKGIYRRLTKDIRTLTLPKQEMVYEVSLHRHDVYDTDRSFKLHLDLIDCRVNSKHGGRKIMATCVFDATTSCFITDSKHLRCRIKAGDQEPENVMRLEVTSLLTVLRVDTEMLGRGGVKNMCREHWTPFK